MINRVSSVKYTHNSLFPSIEVVLSILLIQGLLKVNTRKDPKQPFSPVRCDESTGNVEH